MIKKRKTVDFDIDIHDWVLEKSKETGLSFRVTLMGMLRRKMKAEKKK